MPAAQAARSIFSLADAEGRIPLVARSLVLEGPAGRVLFDPGPGGTYGEPDDGAAPPVAPEGPVDHVVLSHLHADHAAGAFADRGGRLERAFPGARIHVQTSNAEAAARAVAARGGEAYRAREIVGLLAGPWTAHDGEGVILPGIEVFRSDGHTIGMQGLRLRGEEACLMAPADLLPTVSHLRLTGSGEYDRDPGLLARERRELIEEALRTDAWVFLFHDPRHVAVRLGGTSEKPFVREEVVF
jgi:glyoxylase-like metal-dependent hydrolase (beta-lactamase superfamily II)